MNGIIYILFSGAPWHLQPAEYPHYQTCHRYFQAWTKAGVFRKMLKRLSAYHNGKSRKPQTAFTLGSFAGPTTCSFPMTCLAMIVCSIIRKCWKNRSLPCDRQYGSGTAESFPISPTRMMNGSSPARIARVRSLPVTISFSTSPGGSMEGKITILKGWDFTID